MTNEAIEAAARAIRENDSWRTWKGDEAFVQMARAAAPALMEEGARLEREAIVKWLRKDDFLLTAELIEAGEHLPAAIVKGAGPMSETDDLVKRLRDVRDDPPYVLCEGVDITDHEAIEDTCSEAADRIEALTAENERLRGALGLIIENESADTGYGNSSAKIARAALGDWKPEAGDLGGKQ